MAEFHILVEPVAPALFHSRCVEIPVALGTGSTRDEAVRVCQERLVEVLAMRMKRARLVNSGALIRSVNVDAPK